MLDDDAQYGVGSALGFRLTGQSLGSLQGSLGSSALLKEHTLAFPSHWQKSAPPLSTQSLFTSVKLNQTAAAAATTTTTRENVFELRLEYEPNSSAYSDDEYV